MRKVILIFFIFILIGCVYGADYSIVNINGVDFEIPSQYSGGNSESNKYVYDDLRTFAILCVDDYIVNNYGGFANTCDYIEKTSINNRPCMFLTTYNKYIETNVSYIYFPVGESVYCICFRANSITPEISHIIESAPDSNITSQDFYSILDESLNKYRENQFLDKVNDNDYYPNLYHHDNNYKNNNDQLIKWYLLSHM